MCAFCDQERYSTLNVVSDFTAIVAALGNDSFRWNGNAAFGTPVIVTYSFVETGDLPDPSTIPYNGSDYEAFSAEERAAFRVALDEFEARTGVIFVEVDGEAMIEAYNLNDMDFAGYANYAYSTPTYTATGDLVMDVDGSWAPGSSGYIVLLHELGHAMGLEHSHDGNSVLADALDDHSNTVMTYNWGRAPFGDSLAPFDIQALDYLYGTPVAGLGWSVVYSAVHDRVEVDGGSGDDFINTPRGQALVRAAGGDDQVVGREDDDIFMGNAGADTLSGGRGEDVLRGGSDSDSVMGDSGNDRIYGDGSGDVLNGGSGNDTGFGGWGNDTLIGDSGNDLLIGGTGRDSIEGGDGYDVLRGGDGNDTLDGGGWNDTLYGDNGNDWLRGGSSGDSLYGGAGNDRVDGDSGSDRLFGAGGNDTLSGGDDQDTLYGDGGADFLRGDNGNDSLYGGAGADTLLGGDGYDRLYGGSGNDRLVGGEGGGELRGEDGRDVLVGGSGNDQLWGGAEQDSFVFSGGSDGIRDWTDDERISLQTAQLGLGSNYDIDDLRDAARVFSNAVEFDFGDGNVLLVYTTDGLEAVLDDVVFI